MNIKIKVGLLKPFLVKHGVDPEFLDSLEYHSDDRIREYDISSLSAEMLDKLSEVVEGDWDSIKRITAYKKMMDAPASKKISRLEPLAVALKMYLKDSINHWIFEEVDGRLVPYFIHGIEYHPYDARRERPACVSLDVSYVYRGDLRKTSWSWNSVDLRGGRLLADILGSQNLHFANQGMVEDYKRSMIQYQQIQSQTGEQFTGTGVADLLSDRWHRGSISLIQEGTSDKLVMDDFHEEGGRYEAESAVVDASFWEGKKEGDTLAVMAPVHPFLKVFNLDRHAFCSVHVDQLTEYAWDPSLGLKESTINQLVSVFPGIVGRDVKNLLKIVIRYCRRMKCEPTVELFTRMAEHKDIKSV